MSTNTAMLSFKLGPVQPFIEAARTLRDLWSGSYLLSWLTAHAMKPLIDAKATFITPHVDVQKNPLLRAVMMRETGNTEATLACLPHTFAAVVPAEKAEKLKATVLEAAVNEWKQIAEKVKEALEPVFAPHDPDWARNWQEQINCYFEFTGVVLNLDEATPQKLAELRVKEDASQITTEDKLWGRQWNLQQTLLDLARTVRHVPPYQPEARDNKFPVKCSLLGSFEQIGPAEVRAAREFWGTVVPATNNGLRGSRLQSNDKLCAISLVKRFTWAVYWSQQLRLRADELSFTDTATMAARKWLREGAPFNPDDYRPWNGQWLHWATDDQGVKDGDPTRPTGMKAVIDAKAKAQKTRPPTYYALLHLDGDNMGDVFQGVVGKQFGFGRARFQEVTRRLTTFALERVKQIVAKYDGELIYAGGDDVLAFLPTETAIACACALREAFGAEDYLSGATLSGGIAVVHYKEDLRFALGQVRAAEKAAKKIARVEPTGDDPPMKDALALTVCKRSGEHTTAVMGWDEAEQLQGLVELFKTGASDRWAYKLREELETLKHLPLDAGKAEALRLVNRGEYGGEDKKKAFAEVIAELFDAYKWQMQAFPNPKPEPGKPQYMTLSPARNWTDAEVLTGFVTLVQAASFLARGKE